MKNALILMSALLYAGLTLAACPQPNVLQSSNEAITSDELLILTHPTSYFDMKSSAEKGVVHIEEWALDEKIPSLLLHDNGTQSNYYYSNCSPDNVIYSRDGELRVSVKSKHVYIAGGYFQYCFANTIKDLVFHKNRENFEITYVSDAIYVSGAEAMQKGAEYTKGLEEYMRSSGQKQIPLSMVIEEIMKNRYSPDKRDYLANYIERSSSPFSEYIDKFKVIVNVGQESYVWKNKNNTYMPTLKINILTSKEIADKRR